MRHSPRLGSGGTLPTLALLAVTACWGSTFFLIHDLLRRVPVLDFLSVRFAIAAVVLVAVAPKSVLRLSRAARGHAVVLGLVYGLAQVLQTTGLEITPASVSGFITGMYVVCTPLLAAPILRQRIGWSAWLAVAMSAAGLAVLSLRGLSIGSGEALILASAVLYALHIVGLGAWSRPQDAFGLSVVQMVVIAVVTAVATAPNGVVLPDRPADWASVVYMAVAAGSFAILAQTWAQAHLAPTRAAIVMTMEPVFAAVFAVLFGGESTTWRLLLGGGLVLAAMYVVELTPRRPVEGEVPHISV